MIPRKELVPVMPVMMACRMLPTEPLSFVSSATYHLANLE